MAYEYKIKLTLDQKKALLDLDSFKKNINSISGDGEGNGGVVINFNKEQSLKDFQKIFDEINKTNPEIGVQFQYDINKAKYEKIKTQLKDLSTIKTEIDTQGVDKFLKNKAYELSNAIFDGATEKDIEKGFKNIIDLQNTLKKNAYVFEPVDLDLLEIIEDEYEDLADTLYEYTKGKVLFNFADIDALEKELNHIGTVMESLKKDGAKDITSGITDELSNLSVVAEEANKNARGVMNTLSNVNADGVKNTTKEVSNLNDELKEAQKTVSNMDDINVNIKKTEEEQTGGNNDASMSVRDALKYIIDSFSADKFQKLISGAEKLSEKTKQALSVLNALKSDGSIDASSLNGGHTHKGGAVIGDYVIIARPDNGNYLDKIKDLVEPTKKAAEAGVNVGQVLVPYYPKDKNGNPKETIFDAFKGKDFGIFYDIQKKISGQGINPKNIEFLNATDESIKQLIEDAKKLEELKIHIDVEGDNNILYDENTGKFGFIDLSMNKTWATQLGSPDNLMKYYFKKYSGHPDFSSFSQKYNAPNSHKSKENYDVDDDFTKVTNSVKSLVDQLDNLVSKFNLLEDATKELMYSIDLDNGIVGLDLIDKDTGEIIGNAFTADDILNSVKSVTPQINDLSSEIIDVSSGIEEIIGDYIDLGNDASDLKDVIFGKDELLPVIGSVNETINEDKKNIESQLKNMVVTTMDDLSDLCDEISELSTEAVINEIDRIYKNYSKSYSVQQIDYSKVAPYVDENGTALSLYRGTGSTRYLVNEKGLAFGTTELGMATTYSYDYGDLFSGKVDILDVKDIYAYNVKTANPFVVDANGGKFSKIETEHIGSGETMTSKLLMLLDKLIEKNNLSGDTFQAGEYEAAYNSIIKDESNPYISTKYMSVGTDTVGSFAKRKGYDSVIFKNLIDNFADNYNVAKNVVLTLGGEEQITNYKWLNTIDKKSSAGAKVYEDFINTFLVNRVLNYGKDHDYKFIAGSGWKDNNVPSGIESLVRSQRDYWNTIIRSILLPDKKKDPMKEWMKKLGRLKIEDFNDEQDQWDVFDDDDDLWDTTLESISLPDKKEGIKRLAGAVNEVIDNENNVLKNNNDLSVKEEIDDLSALDETVDKVRTAVQNKSSAFLEERQIVDEVVSSEIGKLNDLISTLERVKVSINDVISSMSQDANIDNVNELFNNLSGLLDELSNKIDGIKIFEDINSLINNANRLEQLLNVVNSPGVQNSNAEQGQKKKNNKDSLTKKEIDDIAKSNLKHDKYIKDQENIIEEPKKKGAQQAADVAKKYEEEQVKKANKLNSSIDTIGINFNKKSIDTYMKKISSIIDIRNELANTDKINTDIVDNNINTKITKLLDTSSLLSGNKSYTKEMLDAINEFRAAEEKLRTIPLENKDEYLTQLKGVLEEYSKIVASSKEEENILANSVVKAKLLRNIYSEINQNSNMPKEYKEQLLGLASSIQDSEQELSVKAAKEFGRMFTEAQKEIQKTGKVGFGIADQLAGKIKGISLSFIAHWFSLQDITRYLRQALDVIINIDTAVTELRKVSNATESELNGALKSATANAKELGASINEVISAQADWSRLGYTVKEAEDLARISILYKNVGDNIDMSTATSSLISTLKGYELATNDAEGVIDKFNEVANNYAIDSAGIGEALRRSAASFHAANTDLSESIALITAVNTVLQDPDSVGTLFKTLSARIRGASTELSELGEEEDEFTKTTSKLQSLVKGLTGFDIMEDDGKTFKSVYDILLGIGERWKDLTDIQQASLGEALAGKRNANGLYAILNDTETLRNAYQTAENSAGSAMREQLNYEKSIQYSIDRLKASAQEFAQTLASSDLIKAVVDLLNNVTQLGSALGVIPTILASIGSFNLVKNIKNINKQTKNLNESFTNIKKSLIRNDGKIDSETMSTILSMNDKERNAIINSETFKNAIDDDNKRAIVAATNDVADVVDGVLRDYEFAPLISNAEEFFDMDEIYNSFDLEDLSSLHDYFNIDFNEEGEQVAQITNEKLQQLLIDQQISDETKARVWDYATQKGLLTDTIASKYREFILDESISEQEKIQVDAAIARMGLVENGVFLEGEKLKEKINEAMLDATITQEERQQNIQALERLGLLRQINNEQAKLKLSMGAWFSIAMIAIPIITKTISELVTSVNELSEDFSEVMDKYNQLIEPARKNANKDDLQRLANNYDELSDGVDKFGNNIGLTDEQFNKYKETVNEITQKFPSLITSYNDQGDAVLNLADAYGELEYAAKNAIDTANQELITNRKTIEDNYNTQTNKSSGKNFLYNALTKGSVIGGWAAKMFLGEQSLTAQDYINALEKIQNGTTNVYGLDEYAIKDMFGNDKVDYLGNIDKQYIDTIKKSIPAFLEKYRAIQKEAMNAYIDLAIADNGNMTDGASIKVLIASIDNVTSDMIDALVDAFGKDGDINEKLQEAMSLDIKDMSPEKVHKFEKDYVELLVKSLSSVVDENGNSVFTTDVLNKIFGIDEFYSVTDKLQNIVYKNFSDINDRNTIGAYVSNMTANEKQSFINAFKEGMDVDAWIEAYEAVPKLDFSFAKNKETIDAYQSTLSTLGEAYKTLATGGTLTADQLSDLNEEFDGLDVTSGGLEKQLDYLGTKTMTEFTNKMRELGADDSVIELFRNMRREAFATKEAFASLDDALDKTQDKISSTSELNNLAHTNELVGDELIDALQDQEFRDRLSAALENATGDVDFETIVKQVSEGLLGNTIDSAFLEIASKVDGKGAELLIGALNQSKLTSELKAAGIESVSDAIDAMKSTFETKYNLNQELAENGFISAGTLNDIMSNYPKAIDAVQQYMLDDTEENYARMVSVINEYYQEDYNNYCKMLKLRMLTDEAFYDENVIPNSIQYVMKLLNNYDIDARSYKTYGELKAALDKKYYDTKIAREEQAHNLEMIHELEKQRALVKDSNAQSAMLAEIERYKRRNEYLTSHPGEGDLELKGIIDSIDGIYKSQVDEYMKDKIPSIEKFNDVFKKDIDGTLNEIFDFADLRLKEIETTLNRISASIESMESAAGKNKLLSGSIAVKQKKQSDINMMADMYARQADAYLAKVPDAYKALAQNGGIALLTGLDEATRNNINSYREWKEKSDEMRISSIELSNEIKNDLVQQVQNLADEFDRINGLITDANSNLDSLASLMTAKGYEGSNEFVLNNKRANDESLLTSLYAQRRQLQDQMASAIAGGVVVGSDEWASINSLIQQNTQEIISTQESLAETNNTLNNLHLEKVAQLSEYFGQIGDTLDFINDQLDTDVVTKGAEGFELTGDAITSLGLAKQQYNAAKYEVEQYNDAIAKTERLYADGKLTFSQYQEQMSTLQSGQQSAYKKQVTAEENINNVWKKSFTERINYQQELNDKKKEEIDLAKEAYNWQKTLADKTKALLEQQRKVNALAASSSDRSSYAQFVVENDKLIEMQSDMDDTMYEHQTEKQKEALDEQQKQYSDAWENMTKSPDELAGKLKREGTITIGNEILNYTDFKSYDEIIARIKEIQDITDETDTVVNKSAGIVAETIKGVSEETNVYINNGIIDPWTKAGKAVDDFGTSVNNMNANTTLPFMQIQANIDAERTAAENAAAAIAAMMGIDSGTTKATVDSVKTSLDSADTSVDELLADIQKFLTTQYDTSGVTAPIIEVGSMLDRINALIDEMSKKEVNIDAKIDTTELDKQFNRIKDMINILTLGGKLDLKLLSDETIRNMITNPNAPWAIKAHSQGGVVTASKGTYIKTSNNPLDVIAHALGEDVMIAAKKGERVLTPLQNNYWEKWTSAMPKLMDLTQSLNDINGVRTVTPVINIDNRINVNGNADETLLKQMQEQQKQLEKNLVNMLARSFKDNLGLKVNTFNKSIM